MINRVEKITDGQYRIRNSKNGKVMGYVTGDELEWKPKRDYGKMFAHDVSELAQALIEIVNMKNKDKKE